MNEQEMWEAVQNSDADYDGIFFYAVKTTGIFCGFVQQRRCWHRQIKK